MKWIKKVAVTVLDNIAGAIIDSTNIDDEITNTYSARIIKQLIENSSSNMDITSIADVLFPIGRGFIDYTDTDYSNWLGLTWERESVGMIPIGKDANDADFATVGQTGGSKTHTQTVEEMATHTHVQNSHNHTQNAHSHTTISCAGWTAAIWAPTGGSGQAMNIDKSITNWNGGNALGTNSVTPTNNATTATNQNTGGGKAMNIMNPYQVVSYWKRVDPNAKKMISFTISGISYQAEEGMTWEEWCDSNYNIDNYFYETSNTKVYKGSTTTYINSVSKADTIMANNNYTVSVYSPDAPT